MLSFATLFNIYKNENFRKNLSEYLERFAVAVKKGDEEQALYYTYVVGVFLNSMNRILTWVQRQSGRRNEDLILKWVKEYKRNPELLMLAGSVVLLCRDLRYSYGEYNDAIWQYLSIPIKKAKISDRAYDMHTIVGKRKGRGFEHFFKIAGTVKKERFSNDWEKAGKIAYYSANEKKLGKSKKIIEAINAKYKKSQKQKGIYNPITI